MTLFHDDFNRCVIQRLGEAAPLKFSSDRIDRRARETRKRRLGTLSLERAYSYE